MIAHILFQYLVQYIYQFLQEFQEHVGLVSLSQGGQISLPQLASSSWLQPPHWDIVINYRLTRSCLDMHTVLCLCADLQILNKMLELSTASLGMLIPKNSFSAPLTVY
jgi:hypothetical protein